MREKLTRIVNKMYGILYDKYDEWKAGKPPKGSRGHVATAKR